MYVKNIEKMVKRIFSFFWVVIFFWACKADKISVPSYVKVSDYNTKVNSTQGTSNQKFTDMSIHANGNAFGTFPLGTNMPITTAGTTTLLIEPVIEVNGVSDLRSVYELMSGCDTIISLTTGEVTEVIPVFEYYSGVVPRIMADFNSAGSIFTASDTGRVSLDPNGFGGGSSNKCLKLNPNSTTTYCYAVTTSSYYLPASSVGVYLEYNYLSNIDIGFSITGVSSGTTTGLGGAHASQNWNKGYIYMTPAVTEMNDAIGYYLTIYCNYTDSVGTNAAYIDNIKVLSKS